MERKDSVSDHLYEIFKEVYEGEDRSLESYINQLIQKRDLSEADAVRSMSIIMSGRASEFQQAAFLTALQMKGPTAEEIASFAYAIRLMAKPIDLKGLKKGVVLGDTCGTGGGGLETFNISTTIMFILSSCGIIVAKHGNRAITSKCGSADVLEQLGIDIYMEPKKVEKALEEVGIAFIFAPLYHEAFKNVQKVRREIGIPTVFNILGPLVNPAFSQVCKEKEIKIIQILGVNNPELTVKIAYVLKKLNVSRAMVVYGYDRERKFGMDEVSSLGKTLITELTSIGEIKTYELDPQDFGIKYANPQDLIGGTPKENAEILLHILKGEERGPKRDIVLINAACGLYLGGKAKDIKEGIELAKESIDSGKALEKLQLLKEFSKSN